METGSKIEHIEILKPKLQLTYRLYCSSVSKAAAVSVGNKVTAGYKML